MTPRQAQAAREELQGGRADVTAIAAVILDMDGLMVDTEPLYKMAWQGAAAELGYDLDDAAYAGFVGRPTHACERLLIERFGHQFPLTDFRRRWPTRWRDGVERTGVTIKPGLVELLDYLEARRLPVAIATSSEAEYAALTLRGAGLAGRVQAIVTGDTVENGKPAPDIYLKAAALVGATPARCVAFEDSEPGIRAVAAAGMIGILVPEATPSAVATASASWIVPSLHEGRRLLARLVTRGEGA